MQPHIFKSLPNVNLGSFVATMDDEKTIEYVNIMLRLSKRLTDQMLVQAGFGLDLAIGRLTRPHEDLDIIVQLGALEKAKEALVQEYPKVKIGYYENRNPSRCFNAKIPISNFEIYIDVEDLHFSQEEVYEVEEDGKWNWPIKPMELVWMRSINNVPVYFISPRIIYLFKNWQSKRDVSRQKELDDFKTIETNFPEIVEELNKESLLK